MEAAHVRVPGRGAGAAGDPGVQKGVPDVLCARAGLRRQEAGADRRFLGRQAQGDPVSDCEIRNSPSLRDDGFAELSTDPSCDPTSNLCLISGNCGRIIARRVGTLEPVEG